MSHPILKAAIHARFYLTSRSMATAQIQKSRRHYLKLAQTVDNERGSQPVIVPKMIGIDEEMRNWSFFMVLEHNTIVNRFMTDIVRKLANGKNPNPPHPIDPKTDVLPSPNPGREQVDAFRDSVEHYLQIISHLPPLRGTATKEHHLFGAFDAHKWHCMFALHQALHIKQARFVVRHTAGDFRV